MTVEARNRERHAPDGSVLPVAEASLYPRAVLEAQWRAQVDRLTELSIQLHDLATEDAIDLVDVSESQRTMLEATIDGVRREMRDIEDALDRLTRGTYGRCEDCARLIDALRLAGLPAARVCRHCRHSAATAVSP
jgi:RNA polymerase-binding transcription factor DksA